MIKTGIGHTLLQIGVVKVGQKGEKRKSKSGSEYQLPQSFDHFIITTPERGPNGNFMVNTGFMDMLKSGNTPRKAILNDKGEIIGIPIRLMYNLESIDDMDMVFMTRFAAYNGSKCTCEGDGMTAIRTDANGRKTQIDCMCDWLTVPDAKGTRRCKPNGCLTFLIDGGDNQLGGCYKFRTTSFRTISSIMGALSFFCSPQMTGGNLAFLPLYLYVIPQSYTIPTGGTTTKPVVSIIAHKSSTDELRELAFQNAKQMEMHGHKMSHVKEIAIQQMKQIAFDVDGKDSEDFQEEFYPRIPENTEPVTHEPVKNVLETLPISDYQEPESISEAGGFSIGEYAFFEFDKGIGFKSVKIIAFPSESHAEIKIMEDVVFSGKNWNGKSTVKPVSSIQREKPATSEPEPEIPDEIRKKAAEMLELPEYPEEPEECRALTAKCRELMQEVKF